MRLTSTIKTVSSGGLVAVLSACLAGIIGAEEARPPSPDVATTMFQNVCAQCHGPKGEGNAQIKSPSIAHLPSWYVIAQINNFRENRRGTDPTDPQGLLMAGISKALQPDQIHALARHVEKMPMVMPVPTVKEGEADLENGMILFQERCMECHRYNASGEIVFGSPPLTGMQDWYLAEQIRKFKSGKRGTVKSDVNGAKMVFSSQFISDEQTLKDVIAYIMTLNAAAMAEQQPASSPFEKSGVPAKKVTDSEKGPAQ
jgi:cytochrome c553